MIGGAGDDRYSIDAVGDDVIIEAPNGGVDTVTGDVPTQYVLPENIENVEFSGRVLTGNVLDNVITAGPASNTLDGGQGNDLLIGGFLRSTPVSRDDSGSDILIGGDGNDTLIPVGGVYHSSGVIAPITDAAIIKADDVLVGGRGDDTYVVYRADETIVEHHGEGTDTVRSAVTYTLPGNVENLELMDSSIPGVPNGTGNELDNVIQGNSFANALQGEAGNDQLQGGLDDDVLRGGTGHDTYLFNLGDGSDTIEDVAEVGEGNRIQFGVGINRSDLTIIHDDIARTLTIQVGSSGTDKLVLTSFDLTGVNGSSVVETLTFADGSAMRLVDLFAPLNQVPTVTTPLADQIVSEGTMFTLPVPSNTFTDPDAQDTLVYSASLVDGSALPAWLNFDAMTHTFTGTPDDAHVGSLDLRVTATDSGNLSASDSFTLTIQNTNEAPAVANPIADQIVLEDMPLTIVIPASTFTDSDAGDVLTYSTTLANGASLPAWLSFDAATRTFSGTPRNVDVGTLALALTATDSDNLSVSTGFTLTVQNVNDAPTLANPIADQVVNTEAAFTFTIAANTFADVDAGEILTYGATQADGTALPTWLTFNPNTRTFSGTPGVGDAGVITVNVTATDSENLSVSDRFDVVVTIPNLVLTGTAGNDVLTGGAGDDQLFGLAGNDTLTGQAGNDQLDGGTGVDTMRGNSGNDIYVVDVTGDVVAELANEGTDTVQSSITYTLGANVEHLTLLGTTAINGTGNALDNSLTGNGANNTLMGGAGHDTLNGGAGTDTLVGGTGNDIYIVDAVGDVVMELANGGIDSVKSAVTFTLGANVENLTLTDSAHINGTGSSANNILLGNSGNNVLDGGSGQDTVDGGDGDDSLRGGSGNDLLNGGNGIDALDGGSGDDQLLGGAGNDTITGGSGADQFTGGTGNDTVIGNSGNDLYNFFRGDGQDIILDSDPFNGNQDRAVFGAMVDPLDLVISRQANDLRLAIHGSADQITVKDWYLSGNNRIETIQAGNGEVLLGTQVDQLIQAMASFTQQNGLTWDQAIDQRPQEVQAVLAANWQ